jgi:hypothetical protein
MAGSAGGMKRVQRPDIYLSNSKTEIFGATALTERGVYDRVTAISGMSCVDIRAFGFAFAPSPLGCVCTTAAECKPVLL